MTIHPTAEAPVDGSNWRPWMAPAAAISAFALGLFAASIVAAVGGTNGTNASHPTPAVALIGSVVFDLSLLGAAIYFARLRGPLRASDFGFRRVSARVGVGAFFGAGVIYYVVTALYATLARLHGTEKLPSELGVGKSTAALVGAAVFVCVIAPIAEETFFRGFFFGALRRWRITVAGRDLGTLLAAIVTGIVFGLAHVGSAPAQYLVPLAFLGFMLCLVRWRTGSLYPCIALHAVNNALALGINELHWEAGEIFALIAGSLLVIAAVTGPLSVRRTAPAGAEDVGLAQDGSVSAARSVLVEQLREHALVIGKVVLTSGRTAEYLIDAKRAILRPAGFLALARLVADQAHTWRATAVGGMTMGADPIACAALAGGAGVKAFFVREEAKRHGLARRIEGPLLAHEDRLMVVEDVVTTGGSTIRAVEAVREEGHTVCGVLAICDRLAGGAEAIERAADAQFLALTTIDEIYPERPDRGG